jgi:hypothetical protein
VKLAEKRVTARKGEGTGDAPAPSIEPPQQKTNSIDGLTRELAGIIPKTASIGRNGIRTADTANVTIKYADMPLDPRTIRAAGIIIFMGTIKPEDFAAGIAGSGGSNRGGSTATAAPLNLIPDSFVSTSTGGQGRRRSNIRFEGWVDDWSLDLGDEPLITLECTDNTRQLIDQEAPPQLTLDPKVGIAIAVEQYIAEFPQFRGYEVQYFPLDGGQPLLDEVLDKTARKKNKGPSPGDGDSVWDYLVDACGMVSHNIRFEGTRIIIQRPRDLFSGIAKEGRGDDPFVLQGGRIVSGDRLERRLFVYGRNLETISMRRTYARQSAQNVEVRSYIPGRGQVLIARHPPFKKDRQTKANPGDEGEQTYTVIKKTGIKDPVVLGQIAQDAYEQINRNEVEATIETRNLASYGGGADDPDILDMQVMDFIDITIQREEEELQTTTVINLEDTLAVRARGMAYLTALGYDEEFASIYLDAFINVGLVSAFYTRQIGLDWDEDDGIAINIEAVNFAVVERSDKEQPDES